MHAVYTCQPLRTAPRHIRLRSCIDDLQILRAQKPPPGRKLIAAPHTEIKNPHSHPAFAPALHPLPRKGRQGAFKSSAIPVTQSWFEESARLLEREVGTLPRLGRPTIFSQFVPFPPRKFIRRVNSNSVPRSHRSFSGRLEWNSLTTLLRLRLRRSATTLHCAQRYRNLIDMLAEALESSLCQNISVATVRKRSRFRRTLSSLTRGFTGHLPADKDKLSSPPSPPTIADGPASQSQTCIVADTACLRSRTISKSDPLSSRNPRPTDSVPLKSHVENSVTQALDQGTSLQRI